MAIEVSTTHRVDVIDVTPNVRTAVPESITEGTCSVSVPHTTAGIVVNENESRLLADLVAMLESTVPEDGSYEHNAVDDNADAHLRAMLLGESVTVPVRDGDLALGTWQSILFVECDGPRTRRIVVTGTPA